MIGLQKTKLGVSAPLGTFVLAASGLFLGCADCSSEESGRAGGAPGTVIDVGSSVDTAPKDTHSGTAIWDAHVVDAGTPPADVPVAVLDVDADDDGPPGPPADVVVPPAPDGVCPAPDPTAPKVGEPCDVEGASRCSETGMYGADLLEYPKQYMCARPNRLVCSQTGAGYAWVDAACPIPPVSCNKNQAVTCVEENGGTRCCPTRCRKNPNWGGAGDPDKGTVLCADTTVELCTGFPWMVSWWIHGCGLLEESIFAEGHTDCLEWCQGCTYYYPKTQCPALYYCQTECGGYQGKCYIDDDGHAACPDPDATPCKWHDGDCDP